jgi:hypothetical protein
MVINYDWQVPGLKNRGWLIRSVTDGWQVTGITQFISGQPTDVNAGIANININQRIGGSWTEPVRGIFTGDPNASKDRDKYFNFETISLPTVSEALATRGMYPRNFLSRPGINVTDLSVFKNFPLGGDNARKLQLRVEMFNVFNQAQFSDMNRGVTWSSFNAYLADQSAATATINNRRNGSVGANTRIGNGVGEVNGLHNAVSPNRIIQLAVKVFF